MALGDKIQCSSAWGRDGVFSPTILVQVGRNFQKINLPVTIEMESAYSLFSPPKFLIQEGRKKVRRKKEETKGGH